MKKIITLLALVFCLNGNAQFVTIPDAHFVTWLQTNIPSAMNGNQMDTTNSLVTTSTHSVDVSQLNISDLNGIQYFSSLTELVCNNNSLTSLPRLPSSLQILSCSSNSLTTLPVLPSSLIYLVCSTNNIYCFPLFPNSITNPSYFNINANPFICVPNYISAMSAADLAKPLCTPGNLYGCAVPPKICMVSSDSATNFNFNTIYWDKTGYTNVDSFIVNRYDGISSSYLRVGAVSKNSLSKFTDTCFNIGGPNGGNPLYGSWKYALRIRDTLGNYGELGAFNQTMFVQQNGSNFNWNAYGVGAGINPVTSYSLLRDNNNTGNWQVLVNTTNNLATDPNYANYPNGNWRVDAVSFNCTPTMRLSGSNNVENTYSKSHSNTTKPLPLSVFSLSNLNNQVIIYPNPSSTNFVIETSSNDKQTLQVFDVNGKMVLTQSINGKTNIDVSNLAEGVYNLSLQNSNGVVNKRLVIVR